MAWSKACTLKKKVTEETVRELYQRARDSGETVSENMWEWAKDDVTKVGAWEYRIVELDATDLVFMEAELNRLGSARWECIWIETLGTKKRFFMKKARRSYLKHIPAGDLLKMIPKGDG